MGEKVIMLRVNERKEIREGMSAYEWKCGTMCTCTILIVNLPAE